MLENTTVYTVRREFWAWGDSYLICEGDDLKELYKVTSTVFAWRKEFFLRDMNDNIILRAQGQGHWFAFSYDIFDTKDRKQAEITQNSVWSTRNYSLSINNGGSYDIAGNFSKSAYTFSKKHKTVAECSRPFWAMRRKYTLNISANLPESEHQYLLLSIAAMDIILQAQSSN